MFFDNTLSWKVVSKDEYVKSASDSDLEYCYYIHTENGVPYLRADIEYGGEIELRAELMNFALVPEGSNLSYSMNISDLAAECRGYYSGGIGFIEYETWDEADDNVLNDFLSVRTKTQPVTPIYIICRNDSLRRLIQVFPDADLFLLIKDTVGRDLDEAV